MLWNRKKTNLQKTVVIFGKEFPEVVQNGIKYKYVLPVLFDKQRHFSAKECYAEVIKNHPEYKRSVLPTDEEMKKLIIEGAGRFILDGANSVPLLEKKYGVKIRGNYKYPHDMSDIEYNFYKFDRYGLPAFNRYANSEAEAYLYAWDSLQHDPSTKLKTLQHLYKEMIILNPDLAQYKFDVNSDKELNFFLAGLVYGFPISDIMAFIKGNTADGRAYAKNQKENMQVLEKYGINPKDIRWIPSDETVRNLVMQMQNQKAKSSVFKTAIDKLKQKTEKAFKQIKNSIAGRY